MEKMIRRTLSLLLCLVMLVGILPAGVLHVWAATEDPIIVIAGSDFQHDGGNDDSAKTVKGILGQVSKDYSSIDGFLFAGDYSNNYDTTSSKNGKNALEAAVKSVYNTDWNGVYVQGNHDEDSLVTDGTFSPSGENDTDDYGVFVIHEQDYMWHNDDEARIQQTASNLDAYLDAKVAEGYTKPIFVISHLPLHYTMRNCVEAQNGKGDGTFANYIFDVLNEGGENGLDIIFLYGHNHAHGWDDYIGGEAVYLAVGDKINIAQKSTTVYKEETLNFTYMNAGFTGYYTDECDHSIDSEDYLTMTVFEITDSQVLIKRYNQSGEYNLKSVGRRNTHVQSSHNATEKMTVNTDTYESGQTIALTVPKTVTCQTTGITVTAPNITDITVTQNTNPTYDAEKYSAYVSYDITLTDYTDGINATVTIPVPEGFDTSKPAVVLYNGVQIAKDIDLSDGITFTTNHFSEYDVAQLADGEVENWVEIPGESTDIFRLTDSLTAGKKYVIVSSNAAGTANAVNLNGTSINSTSVTIIEDSKGNYIVAPATTAQWTYNSSSKFQSVSNTGRYLRGRNSGDSLRTTTNSNDSYTSWTYSTDYGLKCNNGRYIPSSITGDMVNASTTNRVYIFVEDKITVVGGYAGMTGQTNYNLVTGRYADQAAVVNMIKDNITVYFATDDEGSDATATTDYQITGTVDPGTEGTYTLKVVYEGKELGTITVNVSDKAATNIEIDPMEGSVERGSGKSVSTGSTMTVTYDDGTTETIPVTVGMLSGTYNLKKNGTYTGLSITYAGKTVTGYTLKVVDVVGNDFPSYPEPGSINVNKTASGQDFQNTGVARVELSTSGLPVKHGVDVIIMLDTSSSMQYGLTTSEGASEPNRRIDALETALTNLLKLLQTKDADGNYQDIDIAIADFNGNKGHIINENDYFSGVNSKINDNNGNVFTNNNGTECDAEDFKDIGSINITNITNQLNTSSGTNYDWAFETIYKLGAAKQAANGDEERELVVIFMSDGAPFQWNHFSGNGNQPSAVNGVYTDNTWEHWITGEMTDADWDKYQGGNPGNRHFYNEDGLNWMAEAVKGTGDKYPVIYNGTDLGTDASADYGNYFRYVPGLGATVYTIGLSLYADGNVGTDAINTVMSAVASTDADGNPLYTTAYSAEELNKQFADIGSKIIYAAQNAYFEDQMGTAFDLQMNPTIKKSDGTTTNDISTDITVKEYPIYTKAQIGTTVNSHTVTADDVGKTYGSGTVLETVTFTSDTAATSTALPDETNIIKDGVICAKNFFYNTTSTPKTITLANGTKYDLPGETFYWNIGTINEKQFTLSYAVYLTGSMEGTRAEGSYDTNEYATLHYTNWLGNDVKQDVPSPTMPWGAANVSYAFYLVNSKGEPVDANGNVVENVNVAYKVTQPVLYKQILLNSGETVLSTVADDVLPTGYTLYDTAAVYTVTVNSGNGGGGWTITGSYPASTYVTNHAGENEYSNETPVNNESYDYTHTTVYFAVVWTIGTVPDTVVIDFGLPVDIDVMYNDMFGNDGTLVGVGEKAGTLENANGFGNTYTGKYGTATLYNGKVRYTPANMQMNGYDQFTYAVRYTGTTNSGYYYGTVTVIPATTIYYEDSFLTFESYTWDDKTNKWADSGESLWSQKGTTVSATQSEDRPGQYSLSNIDANNIYGYDGAYTECSEYSLGSAMKATVDYDSYAVAKFTFIGTGFDVVSMTTSATGTLAVIVRQNGETVKSLIVDTYYGYKQVPGDADGDGVVEDGEMIWVVDPEAKDSLYQVPVMKVEGLTYGKYDVEIQALYEPIFDHVEGSTGYDLYLDAIRIYDPANDGAVDDDTVIEDAYTADGEGWPSYFELRNHLIDAKTLGNASTDTKINGLVFIDGDAEVGNAQISDYISFGPNNEVYLAPGQSVAFILDTPENIKNVHIGIKSADGKRGSYTITNIAQVDNSETGVKAGAYYGAKTYTIYTTTDMYYDLTGWMNDIIVITNTGDMHGTEGIISLTNIKFTYTSNPDGNNGTDPASDVEPTIYMTRAAATLTLRSLNAAAEENVPDEIVPDETVPDETVPEETVPEETVPEETVPEETEPEDTTKDTVTAIVGTIIERTKKAIGWLIGLLRP